MGNIIINIKENIRSCYDMPDLGPLGRGGARRRTRRRMERRMSAEGETGNEPESEYVEKSEDSDKLEKLAKLLRDKGVITEQEFNLLFD
jgi:hypothetical protein